MASCKFEGGKYHSAIEAKAHMRHDDIKEESRAIAARKNPHIDVTKSHLNKSLLKLSYEQMCERYDNRISLLDATTNSNKRKDRVTLQNIEIPVPKELERESYNKWFVQVATILCQMYGWDNFIEGQIHFDEEHGYIDANTHEYTMSRVHAHFSIVPEINGVLNCKKISSCSNMKKLNKLVEDMTQADFGCSFMTGQKKRSRKTIDELKNESSRLEFQDRINQLQSDEANLKAEQVKLESQIQALQVRATILDEKQAQLEALTDSASQTLCESNEIFEKSKQLYNALDAETKVRYSKKLVELNHNLLPRQKNRQKECSMSL